MNDGLPTPDEHGTSGIYMMMQRIDVESLIWELANAQAGLTSMSEKLKRTTDYLRERSRLPRVRPVCVLHEKTDDAEWWHEFETEEDRERFKKERKIWAHYDHARTKHPYFCDKLVGDGLTRKGIDLDGLRTFNESRAANNELQWVDILNEEAWEVLDAIVSGDKPAAIEECYDSIAVLLRVIDVLEGRQPLGRPEEGVAK